MPVAAKLTHDQREQLVLTDLNASFPDFTALMAGLGAAIAEDTA